MPDQACAVESCGGRATRRGWCQKHYLRWQTHGDPLVVSQPKVREIVTVGGVDSMRCGSCGQVKPLTDFSRSSGTANGYRARCRLCDRDKHRAYVAKNREHIAARTRRNHLKKYGLTEEQYAELIVLQGGRCAICRTDNPGARTFHVDHDHETGAVRGLLCSPCNTGIGQLGDDTSRLAAAIAYLNRARGH